MLNLRAVDLNLLPVFEAVYEERNMTRAADRLAMTQPAVSNAVARLRTALRDEVFVPGRRGTVVTPVAEKIYPRVKEALDRIREGFGETREFHPRRSDRRFSIGTLYYPGPELARAFGERMQRDAPRLSWRFRQIDYREEGIAALRAGSLDFLVDYAPSTAKDLDSVRLFDDALVVVAAGNHPRLGRTISRKQFLAERHAAHGSLRVPGNVAQIEGALGDRALDVAVEVRQPMDLPVTVAGTDFIAVCNRRLAEPWAKLLGLKLLRLPFRAPPLRCHLLWHRSRARDAGHAWLRTVLPSLVREVEAGRSTIPGNGLPLPAQSSRSAPCNGSTSRSRSSAKSSAPRR